MSRRIRSSLNVADLQLRRNIDDFPSICNFPDTLYCSKSSYLSLKQSHRLEGHEGCVNVIAFNAEGDKLVSGSDDGEVRIWNPFTNKCLRRMRGHESNVFAASFLPVSDDCVVSGGNDAEMKYYNISDESATIYSHHDKKVLKIAVHNAEPHSFMSCSSDGTVRKIDVRQNYEFTHSGLIEDVRGRTGGWVVPQALGGGRRVPGANNSITSSLLVDYNLMYGMSRMSGLYCVDWNPADANQFIASSEAGDIRLFDLRMIKDHSACSYVNIFKHKIFSRDDITGCAFSNDGRSVIATVLGDWIYSWDVNSNYERDNLIPLCTRESAGYGITMCTHHPNYSETYQTNLDEVIKVERPKNLQRANRNPRTRTHEPENASSTTNEHDEDDLDDNDDDDDDDDNDNNTAIEPNDQVQRALLTALMARNFPENIGEALLSLIERETTENDEGADETSSNTGDVAESTSEAPSTDRSMDGAEPSPSASDEISKDESQSHDMEEDISTSDFQPSNTKKRKKKASESSSLPDSNGDPSKHFTSKADSEDEKPSSSSISSSTGDEASSSSIQSSKEKPERTTTPPRNSSAPLEMPCMYKLKFSGHRSIQTIKGVGFWGPNSEFVVSGSDDTRAFIWNAKSGNLLNILEEGHTDVVNCIVGHPSIPFIATSGIDEWITMWKINKTSTVDEETHSQKMTSTQSAPLRRRPAGTINCAQQ